MAGLSPYMDEFGRLVGTTPPTPAWLRYGEGPEVNWFGQDPAASAPPAVTPASPALPAPGAPGQPSGAAVDSGSRDRTNVLRGSARPDTVPNAAALASFAGEVGAGLSAPRYDHGAAVAAAAAPRGAPAAAAPAKPGVDPFGNEYLRGENGELRIAAPVSRWASANPFDFAAMVGPDLLGVGARVVSELGRRNAERSFATLGNVTDAAKAGFPQTAEGLRAFRAGEAAPAKTTAVARSVSPTGKTAAMLGAPPVSPIARARTAAAQPKTGGGRGGADRAALSRDVRDMISRNESIFADGGLVEGPGGPREDKVAIKASSGEYVVPADVVEGMGGGDVARGSQLLDGLVRSARAAFGKPAGSGEPRPGGRYADGGPVAPDRAKVAKVMREFKAGTLRSGSPDGPVVKDRDQAIAIALSEGRQAAGRPGYAMGGLVVDPRTGMTTTPQVSDEERDLLARTIWGEARGEPYEGQLGVAHVALNRLASDENYGGKTLKDVLLAPKQFSPWNGGGAALMALTKEQLAPFAKVVEAALSGAPDPTGGATYFANTEVAKPQSWMKGPAVQLGRHTFYGGMPALAAGGSPTGSMTAAPPSSTVNVDVRTGRMGGEMPAVRRGTLAAAAMPHFARTFTSGTLPARDGNALSDDVARAFMADIGGVPAFSLSAPAAMRVDTRSGVARKAAPAGTGGAGGAGGGGGRSGASSSRGGQQGGASKGGVGPQGRQGAR